jgi:hypothetical protein
VHALRAAFAVAFDEAHPDQVIALKELMGHTRIETTLVYLRRKNRAKAMEQVRDLSWGLQVPATSLRVRVATTRGAYGIRTRAAAVRGRCPRPLDECAGRLSVATLASAIA